MPVLERAVGCFPISTVTEPAGAFQGGECRATCFRGQPRHELLGVGWRLASSPATGPAEVCVSQTGSRRENRAHAVTSLSTRPTTTTTAPPSSPPSWHFPGGVSELLSRGSIAVKSHHQIPSRIEAGSPNITTCYIFHKTPEEGGSRHLRPFCIILECWGSFPENHVSCDCSIGGVRCRVGDKFLHRGIPLSHS